MDPTIFPQTSRVLIEVHPGTPLEPFKVLLKEFVPTAGLVISKLPLLTNSMGLGQGSLVAHRIVTVKLQFAVPEQFEATQLTVFVVPGWKLVPDGGV